MKHLHSISSFREKSQPTTRSSFNVMFLIQKGKLKASGKSPILARITVNGEMAHLSTKIDILPERWLSKEHRTLGNTREEKQINSTLEDLKAQIKMRYTEFISTGQVVTANKLKQSIMCMDEQSYSYLELCDLFINDYEKLVVTKGYGKESLFRYQLTRRRLAEYISDTYNTADIPLGDVNKRFLDKLYLLHGRAYLCYHHHLSNGIPIESVSKLIGHTNIKTTQQYARITDQKVSGDMMRLREILSF